MLLAIASITIVSCNKDYLQPTPQTSLLQADAFSSPSAIQQGIFGIYSGLKNGNFLGGRAIVYNDVRGEDWLNITGNSVTALGVWNYSITSSDNQVENTWSVGYNTINRANIIIAGIDANPSVISSTLANQYKAEARFCRAVANFYLINFYGRRPFNADAGASPGIPLRVTANTEPSTGALSRGTVAQVYTAILDDLNFAETNLPLAYPVGGTNDSNVVRAHRNAAIALKTRVYLHMNRYSDVITEANKIVSTSAPFQAATGVAHRLNASFSAVFRTPYNLTESIFSLPMTNGNPPGTQNGLSLYHNAEFALNPNGILANASWPTTDSRRTLVVNTTAPFRYSKFNDDLNNSVPIIRYSEVLLNLAEAIARTTSGVDTRALALLNAVRQRSDAGFTWAPATNSDLVAAILTERRIEFLGEGIRSLDILRQNIAFPAKGSLAAVQPTTLPYVWPIPASELLYNSLMTPNN
ncbi:MAG: RagB/SusD family nutrient uptake outer membrane protein [Flavobacterium sp.]|nr:RagB/SusD family nutrient uptake outer membrane protein [Flavobacterium sp.]